MKQTPIEEFRDNFVKFCLLSLIPSALILFLPLSKWSALVWTGGFIGGFSIAAIFGCGAAKAKEEEFRELQKKIDRFY